MRLPLVLFAFGAVLGGCSSANRHGDTQYAYLFDSPNGAHVTPGVLDGTWTESRPAVWSTRFSSTGPGANTPRMALRFTDATVISAMECTYGDGTVLYAGLEAPIQVDSAASTITVLNGPGTGLAAGEGQSYGSYACQAGLLPGPVNYSISGVTLTITGAGEDDGLLTKVSD